VRLDWAILANAAETSSNGLVNMLGAGWDDGIRPAFPAPFAGALALRLLFHPRELELSHRLTVGVVGVDGQQIVEITHTLDLRAAAQQVRAPRLTDEVPISIAINLATLAIPSPGSYAVEIFLDGAHLRTIPLAFHLPPDVPAG
jgi:hypothetical protein